MVTVLPAARRSRSRSLFQYVAQQVGGEHAAFPVQPGEHHFARVRAFRDGGLAGEAGAQGEDGEDLAKRGMRVSRLESDGMRNYIGIKNIGLITFGSFDRQKRLPFGVDAFLAAPANHSESSSTAHHAGSWAVRRQCCKPCSPSAHRQSWAASCPRGCPLQGNRYPALLGEQQQRARRAVPVQLALDPQPLQARAMAPGRIDQVEVADSSIEQGAVHLAVAGKGEGLPRA